MITARNYAAQAMDELKRKYDICIEDGKEFYGVDTAISVIEKAVHFVVPDNGIILNDRLKGLLGVNLRLPYPVITVEYAEITKTEGIEKVVICAFESEVDEKIYINFMVLLCNIHFKFTPIPVIFHLESESGLEIDEKTGFYLNYYQSFFHDFSNEEKARQSEAVGYYSSALFQLLEALSCSNISHEPIKKIDHKKNERRVKAGKLPIYETHVLVINPAKSKNSFDKNKGNSDRNSPRQHLRRGHIRRLPDKNVWVNSCLVGSAENGRLDKSYRINYPC